MRGQDPSRASIFPVSVFCVTRARNGPEHKAGVRMEKLPALKVQVQVHRIPAAPNLFMEMTWVLLQSLNLLKDKCLGVPPQTN